MPHPLPLTPGHALTLEQDHGAVIRRSILPGGVRVFTEHIPGMRSDFHDEIAHKDTVTRNGKTSARLKREEEQQRVDHRVRLLIC